MTRWIVPAIGMLILILDGQTALLGASEGIELCIKTIIPSLFPFFVLSGLLSGALIGMPLRILRPIGRLCGIPKGAESLLAVGLLGGYPVGAQCVASAWKNGQLSRENAERMLGFCNNAGPSFLFGILGLMFEKRWIPWCLWSVHILSAIIVGTLTKEKCYDTVPLHNSPISLTNALNNAIRVMAAVCSWVVLFRIMLTFLSRWVLWLVPEYWRVLIAGLLELSNGCVQLKVIASTGLRMIIAALLLAFGGLCVTMQTRSVTTGLSIKYYLSGKMIQAIISVFLIYPLQYFLPGNERFNLPFSLQIIGLVAVAGVIYALTKIEKRGSIATSFGV